VLISVLPRSSQNGLLKTLFFQERDPDLKRTALFNVFVFFKNAIFFLKKIKYFNAPSFCKSEKVGEK